jgi:hypothetical protein
MVPLLSIMFQKIYKVSSKPPTHQSLACLSFLPNPDLPQSGEPANHNKTKPTNYSCAKTFPKVTHPLPNPSSGALQTGAREPLPNNAL